MQHVQLQQLVLVYLKLVLNYFVTVAQIIIEDVVTLLLTLVLVVSLLKLKK
jgi:hypothetical protein